MKKRNLIIQAAVVAVFGAVGLSAQAGIVTGIPANIAAQAVASNATVIGAGSVAYSTQVPVAIGTEYVYVKLSGGAKFLGGAATAVTAGVLVAANVGSATVTVGTGVISTDQTFAYFPVTVSAAALPVNATLTFKPLGVAATNGGITNAGFLLTAGSFLDATMSIGSTINAAATQADVDTAGTGHAAQTVNGVTFSSLQSGASNFATGAGNFGGVAVETKKISVAAGTGVALTAGATSNTGASTTLINFGAFKFTDSTVAVVAADGTTPFNMATNYAGGTSGVAGTLTGNFGAAAGTGGSVFLSAANSCVGTLSASTLSAGNTVATFASGAAPTSGTATYVCMQVNTPGNTIVIPATTPSLVATLAGASAATATFTSPAATLYALTTDGTTVNVKSYIPAGVAGYTTFIRVINTGTSTANISAAVINDTTGAVGTAGVIAPSVAPGAAVTLTSAQIEAAIGTVTPTTSRPRLQISGPGAFQVQSFILTNANGNFSEVSGAE